MIILFLLCLFIIFVTSIITLRSFCIFTVTQKKLRNLRKQVLIMTNESMVINNLFESAYIYKSKYERIEKLLDDIYTIMGWRCSFFEFIDKDQQLELKIHRGLSPVYLNTVREILHNRISTGDYASGRVISTRQPVIVNDWLKDPHLSKVAFVAKIGDIYSFAAFPIMTRYKNYGTLHLYGHHANNFKLNEVEFFATLANSLSVILENDDLNNERR